MSLILSENQGQENTFLGMNCYATIRVYRVINIIIIIQVRSVDHEQGKC